MTDKFNFGSPRPLSYLIGTLGVVDATLAKYLHLAHGLGPQQS
jgi:hypothetical protein